MPPPDSPGVRLSDAERDALAEALGRHYVEGRLDAEGLGARVEAVYGAATREAARAALADLPEPPAAAPPRLTAQPARRRRLRRRHGEADVARPGWRPTPERFNDPTTGRVMRVWIDPADGARHYVAEAKAP